MLVATALFGAFSACSRATSGPGEVTDQQIALAQGDSARVSTTVVQLVSLQDSRCPSDVVCITAGDVVIVLAFTGDNGIRTDTLRLTAEPRTTTYAGLTFQPTDVAPYPNTKAPAASRTLTLRVTAAP